MEASAGLPPDEACCEVAVCRPLRRRFTYQVPPALSLQAIPGARVLVPFGRTTALGFVVARRARRPEDPPALKPLSKVVDPAAPLTEEHLALALWLADECWCSEGEALAGMVPARHGARDETRVALVVPADEALAKVGARATRQRELVETLRAGPRPRRDLGRLGAWAAGALRALAGHGLVVERDPSEEQEQAPSAPSPALAPFFPLFPAQQAAFDRVSAALPPSGPGGVFLLHGVTGSGKTEVYLHLIREALGRGLGAIFLVPEISLTVPTLRLFQARFGSRLAVLHSRLTAAERYAQWMRVKRGECDVVLGARSAVFAPVRRLGLVLLDEEGEDSYKQQDPPRYHARAVAVERARAAGAAVVLGSATPSLETWSRAAAGTWAYLELPERISGRPMPVVSLVDMAEEFAERRNRSILSMDLKARIAATLEAGGQVLLFQNRRGHSTYVFCRECGHVVNCPSCEVPMTYHFGDSRMRCHHCDAVAAPPTLCPGCQGKAIRFCGAGTERVEEEFKLNFPGVPCSRMDRDTTGRRTAHAEIFDAFDSGGSRVLIGTQMVARGFDFAGLDLAGVVNADSTLNLPDFRSAERTFGLVTQVAGRVGRGERPGHVVVQTYGPHHPALQAAVRHDYRAFAADELPLRRELRYPPYSRLVGVLAESADESAPCEDLAALAEAALAAAAPLGERLLDAVGPGPAFLPKLKGVHRWQLLLKLEPERADLFAAVREALLAFAPPRRSELRLDVDPVSAL